MSTALKIIKILCVYSSLILAIIIFLAVSPASTKEIHQSELVELRQKADDVLEQSNVSARGDIEVVFELVDILLQKDHQGEAEKYVAEALKHFPWNLKYQMIYAELLSKAGKQTTAKEKANLVFQYAETDDLITRALMLLNKEPIPEFEKISKLSGTMPAVVLVPFLHCNNFLIKRIKDQLASILEIPVYIQTIDTEYPSYSRDRRGATINRIRRKFIKDINNPDISNAMKELNLTKEKLEEEENVLKLIKFLLSYSGPDAVTKFDTYLQDSVGKDLQWDADQLKTTLSRSVKPFYRKNIAYLGITSVDIYAKNYNFLFGWASRTGGIMSYNRFTAEFNNETPNQERLIKRTLMQSLSSVGHIYGVERCTDPTCARAYPNSLAEHDAKEGTLCSDCKNGFKAVFKQMMKHDTKTP